MRARILIEAELIEGAVTARRCPRLVGDEDTLTAWDIAHRALDVLLHEWRETVKAEQMPEPA